MRSLTLLFTLLTLARTGHACDSLLGKRLRPEDLRPNMVVRVLQPDAQQDIGIDSYLENMNVRGKVLVRQVKFNANDTLEIDLVGVSDLVRTDQGDYRVRDGAKIKSLMWSHRLDRGTGEHPTFALVDTAEGDGEYFNLAIDPAG